MKVLLRLLTCSLICHLMSHADDRSTPPVLLLKASSPPIIDGILDDPLWKGATVVSDFKQRSPVEDGAPTERTLVLLAYTEHALYVGLHALDMSPEDIVATVMKRDDFDITQNDQFVIAIDTYDDGRNGYWFSTNPIGVRVDGQFFNEGDIFEANWDGVWQCETRIGDEGWTAEIEIPFSTLRFNQGQQNIMGINLFRRIIRINEALFAPLIPLRYENGTPNVSAARKYLFQGIGSGTHLSVTPFVVGGLRNDDFTSSSRLDARSDAGLDIRYSLADNFTANLSLNTDFAEAEADERQINLTRFSLFFPEKRDFFLENSGSFSFGIPGETEIFFSRRIGLAEDSLGTVTSVPLLLGGKLTGRIGACEVGALSVQTRSSQGIASRNLIAARIKYAIGPRSYAGAIFTSVAGAAKNSSVLGVDATQYLIGDIAFSGFAAIASSSSLKIGRSSSAFLNLFRSGEEVSFNIGMLDVGADFDPAIGFVPRSDIRRWSGSLNVPWYIQTSAVRRVIPGYEVAYYSDHSGEIENSLHRSTVKLELQTDDQVTLFMDRTFEHVPSSFQIFRDVAIPSGKFKALEGGIEIVTKQGREFSGSLSFTAGGLYDGS